LLFYILQQYNTNNSFRFFCYLLRRFRDVASVALTSKISRECCIAFTDCVILKLMQFGWPRNVKFVTDIGHTAHMLYGDFISWYFPHNPFDFSGHNIYHYVQNKNSYLSHKMHVCLCITWTIIRINKDYFSI
jgi:hypothetical protein